MKVKDKREWKPQGIEVGDVVLFRGDYCLVIVDDEPEEKYPIKLLQLKNSTIVEAYSDIRYVEYNTKLEAKENKAEVHLRP